MSKEKFTELHAQAYKDKTLPMFTVTHGTKDLGNKFAVRLHIIDIAGRKPCAAAEHYAVADSLEDLRLFMPDSCYLMSRHPDDDPVIVETWI